MRAEGCTVTLCYQCKTRGRGCQKDSDFKLPAQPEDTLKQGPSGADSHVERISSNNMRCNHMSDRTIGKQFKKHR